MFVFYLFLGIGVLTILLLMLPSLLDTFVYLYTLFATLNSRRLDAVEEREKFLVNKHEKKMAKLNKKVEKVKVIEEDGKEEQEQKVVEEQKAEPEIIKEVKEEIKDNPDLYTYIYPHEEK